MDNIQASICLRSVIRLDMALNLFITVCNLVAFKLVSLLRCITLVNIVSLAGYLILLTFEIVRRALKLLGRKVILLLNRLLLVVFEHGGVLYRALSLLYWQFP